MERVKKPLSINPLKLSQPMGAHLFFLGIKNCMPLMHSAQGCASFSKVFFTRHFNDPIAIQTTAVNDITAVIDGGDYSISVAIENITQKVKPDIVGLFTTGLTETKGDDIKGVANKLKDKQKMVYVHTPDFEGGLESGYAKCILATIDQIVLPKDNITNKALLIPNVNMTPIEIEETKEAITMLGFGEVFALPDISFSLDGHLGVKQGTLSSGGISLTDIENLGDSAVVITIGSTVKACGQKLVQKNNQITHFHFDSISGLEASDEFYSTLLSYNSMTKPHENIIRWRKRLQDVMLDTHFSIGSTNFIVALESDQALSISRAIVEAGANIKAIITTQKNELLNQYSENVIIGDFDDVERYLDQSDILITNFHGHRLAHECKKAIMLRGFPNYEEVGNQLKNDTLYKGSAYMLIELANIINHYNGD